MVEGGMKCVKYLLFAFNIIFVITAIALIVCGALVQTEFKKYFDFFGEQFNSAAILLIAVGCIIFFIAAFGCFGAYRENYICTMVFAGLLATIFILEIAGGIAGFVLRNDIKNIAHKRMRKNMDKYGENNSTTKMWDEMQDNLDCCGTYNSSDWAETTYFKGSDAVPRSCCKDRDDCQASTANSTQLYQDGCVDGIAAWAKQNIYKIGAAGIALAFIQIIGIVFACCLARSIRKEYEVV